MKDSVAIFKALGDKTRLTILTSLLDGPMYVEILALRLKLTPATISFHLKKLEEVGLVTSKKEQYYMLFTINQDIIKNTIQAMMVIDSKSSKIQNEREEEYNKSIINSYFVDDKLLSIPVQYMKRRIILEKVSEVFDFDRGYTKREVNIILADFYDDFVNLRKALVKDEFIESYNGVYTRKGKNKFFRKGSGNIISTPVINLPLLLLDTLESDEKIIYELNSENGSFEVLGITNKPGDINRILFSNKGRIFVIKSRGSNPIFTLAIYWYGLFKQNLECEEKEGYYICSGNKLKCSIRNGFAPMGIFNIEFKLKKQEFIDLANSFHEKLFVVAE